MSGSLHCIPKGGWRGLVGSAVMGAGGLGLEGGGGGGPADGGGGHVAMFFAHGCLGGHVAVDLGSCKHKIIFINI